MISLKKHSEKHQNLNRITYAKFKVSEFTDVRQVIRDLTSVQHKLMAQFERHLFSNVPLTATHTQKNNQNLHLFQILFKIYPKICLYMVHDRESISRKYNLRTWAGLPVKVEEPVG